MHHQKNNIIYILLMHFAFLIYSLYAVIGKFAVREIFLSTKFILLYCLIFFILCVYAIIWQQVLKAIPLSIATANKTATIIWGIVFGSLIFKEKISCTMIIGAVMILCGIVFLCTEKNDA